MPAYIHEISAGMPQDPIRRPEPREVQESTQGYVSNELTHFVGRGLDADGQYELLLRIIANGYLIKQWSYLEGGMTVVRGGGFRNVTSNTAEPDAVCFCDIPLGELKIHMGKYSRFGLAFNKEFVAMQGGKPVQYIPRNAVVIGRRTARRHHERVTHAMQTLDSNIPEEAAELTRVMRGDEELPLGDVIDAYVEELEGLLGELYDYTHKRRQDDDQALDLRVRVLDLQFFLLQYFVNHLKGFDLGLADNDPENFYMEREWRIVGKLRFEFQDLARVIVPESYRERLRVDLAEVPHSKIHAV